MKNSNDLVKVNIKDVILDDNNLSPVILYNENQERIEFEQISRCIFNNDLYYILKPITKLPNVNDNQAIVFKVLDDGESSYLSTEDNTLIAQKIFDIYYFLLNNELKDKLLNFITKVIKEDKNISELYNKQGIDYLKCDIHPFLTQNALYAIIKEFSFTPYEESLVFQISKNNNDKNCLIWIENETLAIDIIEKFIEYKEFKNER